MKLDPNIWIQKIILMIEVRAHYQLIFCKKVINNRHLTYLDVSLKSSCKTLRANYT